MRESHKLRLLQILFIVGLLGGIFLVGLVATGGH